MSIFSKTVAGLWLIASLFIGVFALFDVSATVRLYYSNVLQIVAPILCAFVCYYTMGIYPPRNPMRTVWLLLGSGTFAWGIGSILFTTYPLLHQETETPFPYYSDIAYLTMTPLVIIALWRLRNALGLALPLWGIGGAIITFIATVWFYMQATWDGLVNPNIVAQIVTAAYLLSDPLMITMTFLTASTFGTGVVAKTWWYAVVGLVLYFFGNAAYIYLVFKEQYATGAITDIGWPLGFGFIALAAVANRRLLTAN